MSKQRKQHVFVETVQSMADGDWGREFDSEKDAIKSLCGDMGVADAALLEMLRRFGLVVKALVRDAEKSPVDLKKPENAKVFPGVKVGDILHVCWELEVGVHRRVVVSVLEGDFVRTVLAGDTDYTYDRVGWGSDECFTTEAEALKVRAAADAKYYEPRAALSRVVLKAIETGGDLAFVRDGADILAERTRFGYVETNGG